MTRRTFGIMVIFVSVLFLPYWFYLPVLFIAIVLFSFFWEGILIAFMIDTLYGSGAGTAISTLIVLIALLPLRERLRTYA